jgi:hypothetical protein
MSFANDVISGPFASEAVARKHQHAAVSKRVELDPWERFDDFEVSSIEGGFCKPGRLNHLLEFAPGDLLNRAA